MGLRLRAQLDGRRTSDAAYALMNSQASPEAQAIRAETATWSPTAKAIELAPPGLSRSSPGSRPRADALPETYPPNYPDWVKAFQDFKSRDVERKGELRMTRSDAKAGDQARRCWRSPA